MSRAAACAEQDGNEGDVAMPIIGLLVGGLLGALIGQRFQTALAGAFIGLIAGLVVNATRKRPVAAQRTADPATAIASVDPRIVALERRCADAEASLARSLGDVEAAL